jgi:hypothetical protein
VSTSLYTHCDWCRSSEREHHALGLCQPCYDKRKGIQNQDAIVARVRLWQAQRPERTKLYKAKSNQRRRYGFAEGDCVVVPLVGTATCVGKPRYVKGEAVCDLLLDRTKETLRETPVLGVTRAT